MSSYSEDGPKNKKTKTKVKVKVTKRAPSASAWQGWHKPHSMTIVILVLHHVMSAILILALFGSAWGVTPPVAGSMTTTVNGTMYQQVDDPTSASGTEFGLLYTRTITATVKGVGSKAEAASTAKRILSEANPAGIAAFVLILIALVLALIVNVVLWVVFGHIFKKNFFKCCCPKTNLNCATKFIMASIFVEFILVLVGWAEWTGWWLKTGYNLNIKGIAEDAADSRTIQSFRTSLAAAYGAVGWSNGLAVVCWVLLLLMLLILSLIAWWWCCCGKRADKKFKAEHNGESEAEVEEEIEMSV